MAILTMILGRSGTGKSTSLRNLSPETAALIQTVRKPLPFKSAFNPFATDDHAKIIQAMKQAAAKGFKIIIIDDFQYMMANEFMRRSEERGFDKFTEIGRHAWDVITQASLLPDDIRVYLLSHTEESDSGQTKIKTIGKMLDEKICLEGMVTIVLRTHIDGDNFMLSTKNSGSDTVKSPVDLFADRYISNDIAAVDAAIVDYYNLNQKGE